MTPTAVHRSIQCEADARRVVLESSLFARDAGFAEVPGQMIATVVSELSRNILKYAGRGDIRLWLTDGGGRRCLHVQASDQGPGIADCAAAMQDHFSSGGTLGMGLPAVRRMMDEFELESAPGEGTRITACKWL